MHRTATPHVDIYAELGLDPDRSYTPGELKHAYRTAARRSHPDVGGTTDAFWRVRYAYRVLSEPDLLAEWEATGRADPEAPADAIYDDAVNLVLQQFDQVCGQLPVNEVPYTDPFSAVGDHIDRILQDNAHKRKQVGNSLKAIGQLRGRVRYTGSRADVVAGMLDAREKQARSTRAKLERSDAVCERALELLDEYEYELDERQPDWLDDARMRAWVQGGDYTGGATQTQTS